MIVEEELSDRKISDIEEKLKPDEDEEEPYASPVPV